MSASEGARGPFSGGQDSATGLAWALDRFEQVETVGFDYGQRHRVELECRSRLRAALSASFPGWSSRLKDDHMLQLGALRELADTALTRGAEIRMRQDGLPNTFVPGRNLLFFTFAAALAYRRDLRHLIGGMCETDFSGYPDCRDDTIKALKVALNLGTARRFVLHTSLMWLDTKATWKLAADLGGTPLVDLIRDETHTCYLGSRTHRHSWGYGCADCPACVLRRKGWDEYSAEIYRACKLEAADV